MGLFYLNFRGQEGTDGSRKAEEDQQDLPVIWDRAALLNRVMDDEELMDTIIDGFLEDAPQQIEALLGYLEAGDAAGAERQAHSIKGAAANVGGERLRVLAFELEKAGKAGDLEGIKARMEELNAAFEELKHTMKGAPPCASYKSKNLFLKPLPAAACRRRLLKKAGHEPVETVNGLERHVRG